MPHTEVARRLKYPWEELYALVLDVEAYPQFVPFCRTMLLKGKNGDELVAQMEVGFATITERYTSEIRGDRVGKRITIKAIDGPFKRLNGLWTFTEIDSHATYVTFSIDYEFKSRLLSVVEAKAFKLIFGQFINAFEKRASQVLMRA